MGVTSSLSAGYGESSDSYSGQQTITFAQVFRSMRGGSRFASAYEPFIQAYLEACTTELQFGSLSDSFLYNQRYQELGLLSRKSQKASMRLFLEEVREVVESIVNRELGTEDAFKAKVSRFAKWPYLESF